MDERWVYFLVFLMGCIFSYAAFSDSPRKRLYRIIAISIVIFIFILAKTGHL